MKVNYNDIKPVLYEASANQFKNGFNLCRGHSVFRMNIETQEIEKVDSKNNKVEYTFGYIYIPALNINNAVKKPDNIIRLTANRIAKERENAASFALQGDGKNTQVET